MRLRRVLVLSVLLVSGCRASQHAAVSTALHHELEQSPLATSDPVVQKELVRFYEALEFHPAWVTERTLTTPRRAIALLGTAAGHGLDPEAYDRTVLEQTITRAAAASSRAMSVEQIASLDVGLSTALLTFGRDVAIGHLDPSRIDPAWKSERAMPDLASGLLSSKADLDAWILSIEPRHPEYEALHRALLTALAAGDGTAPGEHQRELRRLAINLERWRWMPDDFGDRHLLVNIPSFDLRAREHGTTVMTMRVVVGKPNGHETPIFGGVMQTIVFSPYWNVPESIAVGETAPAVAKDASYLEHNDMELFRRTKSGKTLIDPDSVDWTDASVVRQLEFRQRPGRKNALGTVKFLFPNAFDVYLHDTPSVGLFARASRALSHGCVRVAEPEKLAQYTLRGDPSWDEAQIAAAMSAGVERHVKLNQPLPVHIVYFTSWVDDDGRLHTEPDIYGYDAKQIRLMTSQDS